VQGGAARVSAPLPDTAAAGSGEQASPVGLRAASLAAAKVAGSASESESAAPAGATGGARPGPGEPAHQIAAQPVSSPLANAAATTAAAPLERSDQSLPGTLSAQAHPAELRAQILRSVPSESREMRLEGTAAGRTPGTGGGAAAQSTGGMSPAAGGDTRRSRDEAGEAEQPARLAPAVEESTPSQNSGGSDAFKLGQVAAGGSGRAGAASPEPTRLADLAEAAEAAIHVNAQAGVSAARITLQPQELGGVEIRLSYQSGGVSATIHADSSQAAQTLQQAIPDLRRALEGHGLSLLSLDVHDRSGSSANGEPSPRQQGGGQAAGAVNDELEETAPNSPDLSTVSALGSRIDVFA
jgi:flagellar hook-length control protein FliK